MPQKVIAAAWLIAFALSARGARELATLENGLQYVVVENRTAPVAALRIYVRTGSIDEEEYLGAGISHLFEHLINGGTTSTYAEAEITDLIDRLGGANNAYTTKDHTCYHITTSADKIGEAIDLMADWMANSTFPQNEFEREMKVVMEELYKGKEETGRILSQAFTETMFQVHPVRYPTIGYEEQVRQITRDDIVRYYQRMYVPNNMLVAIAGDFDRDEVVARLGQAFGGRQRRAVPALTLPAEPPQLGRRQRVIEKEGLGGAYFRLGFRTVPITHPDLYPLDVLSYVLSRGGSSRLVRVLREEKRLVSSIGTYSATPAYDAGVFAVYGTCKTENIDAVVEAVLEELYRTRDELIADDELAKAKRQKIAGETLDRQTAADEASEVGINVMTTGNPDFTDVYLRGIEAVTAAQVQAVARRYFFDDNLTLAVLRPPAAAAGAVAARQAAADEPISKVELANGLRVLIKRNPSQPIVNLRVLHLGGVRLEPVGQAGVSRITSELMRRGAAGMSRDDIAQAFDRMGGRLSPMSANNTLGLTAEMLAEDFAQALDLVVKMVRQPTFPEAEFATVQQNTLESISQRLDSWGQELSYLFRKAYFTEHPYRNDSLGEAETVQQLSVAQCRAFYELCAVPSRTVVTVFGDIDPKQAEEAVRAAFSDWQAPAPPLPELTPQPPPPTTRKELHESKRQLGAVYFGYSGMDLFDEADRYAMTVLDAVLSGISYPGGRLHQHLRGDRDLVYLVHAFNFVGIEPGYFGVMAAASPANLPEVIEIILKDIDEIKAQPVSAEELDKAKTICATMEKLDRQTNGDMALQAGVDELYGLGYNYADGYVPGIEAVTAAEVQRVARKYLTAYVMVQTGPTAPAPAP